MLIKAYYEHEGEDAVPVDIIEKKYEGDVKVLLLPRGNYYVVIENQEGKRETRNISVE